MNLLKALAAVSSMTLLSRILGFVRDTVIARAFGAGATTDGQYQLVSTRQTDRAVSWQSTALSASAV